MITIVKSSLDEIHDTIKTMFSYALALTDSQIPTVYELGHYLADNILAKICLAVAIDKGEEQQTYTTTSSENGILYSGTCSHTLWHNLKPV